MESNKNISAFIFGVAIIIATVIAAYTVNLNWQKKLLIEAVNGCALTNRVSWTDQNNGASITEVYEKGYKQCLVDKGYEN